MEIAVVVMNIQRFNKFEVNAIFLGSGFCLRCGVISVG